MKHELIGQKARIMYAKRVFNGIIVDETKNTLRIKTEDGIKTIIKENSKIMIQNQEINGKKITKRPEDRIKK